LERLDDCGNEFHEVLSLVSRRMIWMLGAFSSATRMPCARERRRRRFRTRVASDGEKARPNGQHRPALLAP
ncbi:hypothetical protein, partial [Burkholderia multivorans]|uniref:hypothetical protein n=1 Tax=Burkholderia multivorans TaxID=87883 RepID=UPI001C655A5F